MSNIRIAVNKIVEHIASSKSGMFYPNGVAQACELPLTTTLTILNEMTNMGKLELKYEIKSNGQIITTTDNYANFLSQDIVGLESKIDLENVYPVYCSVS